MIVSIPVATYNLLRFVEPALPPKVSSRIAGVTLLSCLLSLLGIAFAYYISLPAALIFLSEFSTESVQSLISANEYFSFVTRYLGGFALVFQLPLALITINRITPLRPGTLMRKQGVVLLLSFLVAAVLTPTPDPINQAIMAAPIVILYQFAVLWIWIVNRKLPPETWASASTKSRSKSITDIKIIKR
jgi:sec-independent protein translocase protein TatC